MRFVSVQFGWLGRAALASSLALAGCSTMGSQLIENGRIAYTEVIQRTNDEQMLNLIVRARYGEAGGLLVVSSVTANVSIQGSLMAQLGIGPDASFDGNLVPLAAGAVYEENPTISYTPLQGEQFLRQLLAPLPVDTLGLIAGGTGRNSEFVLELLVEGMNGLGNPLHAGTGEEVAAFAHAAALIGRLQREGIAHWTFEDEAAETARLVLEGYTPRSGEVRELMDLLGFRSTPISGADIVLPLRMGVGVPAQPQLRLRTRSALDVIEIAAAQVELPDPHRSDGVSPPRFDGIRVPREFLRIHSSEDRPEHAVLAVPVRGYWFYIDDRDTDSKLGFRMLVTLLEMRLSQAVPAAPPTLTIPASR